MIKFEGGSYLDLQVLNESAEKEVKNELNSKESLQPKSDRQNGNKEISMSWK